MGKLDEFVRKAESLDMAHIINTAIKYNEDEIVYLNTKKQLEDRGITSFPRDINRYRPYRPRTIELKQEKGQETKWVTLKDTGEFHGSFYIKYNDKSIEITAPPNYRNTDTGTINLTEHLMNRYGRDIFGLTPHNVTQMRDIIFQDIVIQVRNNV